MCARPRRHVKCPQLQQLVRNAVALLAQHGLEPTIQQVRKQSCSVATASLTSSNLSPSLFSIPMSGASQPFTVDAIIAEKTHEAGETGGGVPLADSFASIAFAAAWVTPSACAPHRCGVQFLISHLTRWLCARRFSEPTFALVSFFYSSLLLLFSSLLFISPFSLTSKLPLVIYFITCPH